MQYGDRIDNFYILLSGHVRAHISNENINDWNLWAGIKNALDDWKNVEFDQAVQHEMMQSYL